MPGFILRASPTGHRSYYVVYGSGPNKARYKVAPLHRMSLADARKKARSILKSVDDGRDPQAELVEERRTEAGSPGESERSSAASAMTSSRANPPTGAPRRVRLGLPTATGS